MPVAVDGMWGGGEWVPADLRRSVYREQDLPRQLPSSVTGVMRDLVLDYASTPLACSSPPNVGLGCTPRLYTSWVSWVASGAGPCPLRTRR